MNLRFQDTIIQNRAYGTEALAKMVNPAYGGQHGAQPNYTTFISNKPYVRKPMIVKVLTYPKLFDKLPDSKYWRQTYKSILEEHALTISGVQFGITGETDEVAFGGGGEFQQVVTKTRRARSNVSIELNEKIGRPFAQFHNSWLRLLHMEPETNYAGIIGLLGGTEVPDLLPDQTTGSIICFEPNETFSQVQKAVLITNFFPLSDGTQEMNKDMTANGQMENHSIEYACLSQHGYGVLQYAQSLLSDINRSGLSPFYRQAFINEIDAGLEASDRGYTEAVEEASRELVRS